MDSTVLLMALLLASVHLLSGAPESPNSTCPFVTSLTIPVGRDENDHSVPLSCRFNGTEGPIIETPGVTISWHYINADGLPVEITNNSTLGHGINFTLHDRNSAKNVLLDISLPLDSSRIIAERNYTCGCVGYNATGVHVLIVQPLRYRNEPLVHAAEIGKSYDLPCPFELGLNRLLLTATWSRETGDIAKSDSPSITVGYKVNEDLNLHFDSVTEEDASSSYSLQVTSEEGSFSPILSGVTLIPFTKPVIQPVFPNISRLVLYNGVLEGGMISLMYSHTGIPVKRVKRYWDVSVSDSLYSTRDSDERTSEFSFVQAELDGGLDGPLSVVNATFYALLNISEVDTNLTHEDNATVTFYILTISQPQHFQVVFERPSFTILLARITYPQLVPAGFDFEVVFFIAGQKVHSVPGTMGSHEQVVLISLDDVVTVSSVTARMEFVYSDDRFAGPEVTTAIPLYCTECIIGAVCGAVLLLMGCIVAGVIAVVMRRHRRRKHRKHAQTLVPGSDIASNNYHSSRNSYTSDRENPALSIHSGVDQGSIIHGPCMLLPMAMHENCSNLMPPACGFYLPASGRGMRPINDYRPRACNSAMPEECCESDVDRQPPMRQRSYSEGQLADSLQVQRLENSRLDVHHYDIPRRSSNTRVNNECFSAVPRGRQSSSEMESISTGVQSNHPLVDNRNSDRLSSVTQNEGEDVVDTIRD